MSSSPSEWREAERQGGDGESLRHFVAALPFPPDHFQLEAFESIDRGRSVLVSAPTGSGKTLVANFAVHRAVSVGGKAFYTTPLKALSNQKYAELVATYGTERVGLLTGDTALRPEAPVVVMTTEVLRNMLLAGSSLLEGLCVVVLDEVHYLQDPYRGGVWEEVLVLCPPDVMFVCLSATVANAAELGDWLRSVRGPTDVVVERRRPITLRNHFAVHRRESRQTTLVPMLTDGRASHEGLRLDQATRRSSQGRQPHWRAGRDGGPRSPFRTPRRTELLEELDDLDLLPSIVFIFSRAACEDAVRQCLRDGVRLTDHHDRAVIRRIAEAHVEHLADDDLRVLGYGEWLEGLEAGVAAHHAGMVPAYREAVEACFSAGLLRVVFATETLSLGINMPARTVVIERFTKFGGSGRAPLTSGEYAQLTGRAGRRGLDAEGHAVVLWSSETTFAEVARIAVAPPSRPSVRVPTDLQPGGQSGPPVRPPPRPRGPPAVVRPVAGGGTHIGGGARQPGRPAGSTVGRARGAGLHPRVARHAGGRAPRPHLPRVGPSGRRGVERGHPRRRGALGARRCRVQPRVRAPAARARRPLGHVPHGARAGHGTARGSARNPGRDAARTPEAAGRRPSRSKAGDRLGERRRAELVERTGLLAAHAETVRATEEVHLVPRTRQPEPGLARAIAAWARGASFGTVLELAALDVGELAPGDFVRTVKQVADLAEQVAVATTDPATAAAADAAVRMLVRDVVAAGGPAPPAAGADDEVQSSAPGDGPQSSAPGDGPQF